MGMLPDRASLALATLAALLLLVACGENGGRTAPDPAATPSPTGTASAPTDSPPDDLPGEPTDLGPAAGDVLGVVGVAHDDQLDVRERPGSDAPVLGTLEPLADDVAALGNSRFLPGSMWTEVEAGGTSGWVDYSFVAYLGDTTDETSAIVQELGRRPGAPTMRRLGRRVAEAKASTDPRSSIVLTVAPAVGDPGEVTYDVIGLGDDSILGYRLHVFGAPSGKGSRFSLTSVEQTSLCDRGVTEERLCV